MKYIISSGWWCKGRDDVDTRKKLLGDDYIREKKFFKNWYESINRFTSPTKIIVVDSASPVKPDLSITDNRLEFISLDENAGHATSHSGKYCGYTRAIFSGMGYAISCNADYWVYVEQDALLYGNEIIERAIKEMNGDFLYGSGYGTPQVLQQSFIIMKTSIIPQFIKNYTDINYTDNEISPELKFAISCHPFYKLLSFIFLNGTKVKLVEKLSNKILSIVLKKFIDKNAFSFGYGRARPINFNDDLFYFQHGSKDELLKYMNKVENN